MKIPALLLALLLATPACAQNWAGGPATGSGYPNNAIPVTNSAAGSTGAVVATLPAQANFTTFICGFVISSGALVAANAGVATVAGTISGTLNFTYFDPSSGQGLLGVAFPVCIPASGPSIPIVVTKPATGSSGSTSTTMAWGYQLRQ